MQRYWRLCKLFSRVQELQMKVCFTILLCRMVNINKCRYRVHVASLYNSLLLLTLSGNKNDVVWQILFHNDLALDIIAIHICPLCSTCCIICFVWINLDIEKLLLDMFRRSRSFYEAVKCIKICKNRA